MSQYFRFGARAIFLLLTLTQHGYAFSWRDLWVTKNQQAQIMMNKGQYLPAKETFERNDWRASAAYRAGEYELAAKVFEPLKNERSYYNLGNSLAHMGKYEQAIKAYNQALAINPNNQDAQYNRKLVDDLLKKDKQNQDKQNQDKQNQDKQNQDKQNQDKQNQDKQNQDKQNQDKQNQDKQNQDKQNQQDKNKQDSEQKKNKQQPENNQDVTQSEAAREKQQAKEQWLRLIPDDPGGLMREKFLRDHLRRQHGWYQ